MISGVAIGLVSAVMQSGSYIFSRRFVSAYDSSLKLVLYSQLWMGLFGIAGFAATLPWTDGLPRSREFFAVMTFFVVAYNIAFFCFFRAVKEIEASRISSLLGLKVAVIALITLLLRQTNLNTGHLVAILLTAFAAVGMNFSGGRINRRGALYLFLTLFCFASTDISGTRLVQLMPGRMVTVEAICVTSLAYIILGAISCAAFAKIRFEPKLFAGALPYSALWFVAMLLLFASFGIIGVVFGSIIQALRGVFSVLFGILLAKRGASALEPDVPSRLWIRRAVMAVLMVAAIALYSIS